MVAMVPEGFRHWPGRIQYVRTVAVIVFRIVSEVGARASASHGYRSDFPIESVTFSP